MWKRTKHDCATDGHSFEPRYDTEPGHMRLGGGEISHAGLEMLIEASTKKTYVYDICTKCGVIVQRPSNG